MTTVPERPFLQDRYSNRLRPMPGCNNEAQRAAQRLIPAHLFPFAAC
ncbi:hypothetical protein SXCC_01420 [Gluconacetobacter sp. SXCC-1]|nr:hypothetical protein SXCC_01420 [Gluconacetobacter sp. SXCC-1]